MSESNGNGQEVLRIGRKGKVKAAFGAEGKPFEFDVIKAYNEWFERRRELEDESGKVPRENYQALRLLQYRFVCELAELSPDEADLTAAEVEEFMEVCVFRKAKELLSFFAPATKDEPSSQGSTEFRYSG